MNPEELDILIGRLDRAVGTDELFEEARSAVRNWGFSGFAYHLYRPDLGIRKVGDWPEEWDLRYREKGYIDIDPVVRALLNSTLPFTWEEAARGLRGEPRELVTLREARDFGLREGAEVPMHLPGFEGASFSVFSDGGGREFHESWRRNRHLLHVFAHYFHQKYQKAEGLERRSVEPLAPRERECLVWTARNKTAWEIGEILQISEHTVKGYLRSACDKLGVYTRHQAVIKAILERIILP